jgi:hypothetical protein
MIGCAPVSTVGTSSQQGGGVKSVAGTVWAGQESDGDYYEFHFIEDGSLNYNSPSGFWTNGTWRQDGTSIYMETNNKFSERKGVITGTVMKGSASNVKGAEWTWTFELQEGMPVRTE